MKILVVVILPLVTVVGGWYWRCNVVVDEKLDHDAGVPGWIPVLVIVLAIVLLLALLFLVALAVYISR